MNELATIRRAYRYVVAYERRILDAVARIDEVVRDAGFVRNTPLRWWPLYRSFPSRDWAPDRWAWDHVPCYAARYQWNAGEENAAGARCVLVDHIADTAFETKRLTDGAEPEPLGGLPAVEESRSVLRWLVIEFAGAVSPALWKLEWGPLLAKQLGVPLAEILLTAATAEPVLRRGEPLTLTTSCTDLASIADASALDARFIEPLRAVLDRASLR